MLTEKQIAEIREKGLFDFLGNSAWELDKETIISMFKEFNYAVYDVDKNIEKQTTEMMLNEIKENYI